jgi:hypothetical protein
MDKTPGGQLTAVITETTILALSPTNTPLASGMPDKTGLLKRKKARSST